MRPDAIPSFVRPRHAPASRGDAILPNPDLPPASARRAFDEADVLITEAEKLGPNDPDVLAARGGWLLVQADRFETDPGRRQALSERGKCLLTRSIDLRQKKR